MIRNFVAYATANDDPWFVKDALNLRRMARRAPGVSSLRVVMAVSAVRPFTAADRRRIGRLCGILERSPHIEGVSVILKGNIGRDFSSAYLCLKEIAHSAEPDDVVMVKNRSGYGPLTDNWFGAYAQLLASDANIGLVGSTINFDGHPERPLAGVSTHVQTYVYMSRWRTFAAILDSFPAIRVTDRIDLIVEGEIGLSKRILEGGQSLACLMWPSHRFTREVPDDPLLPQDDVKKNEFTELPFRYRFSSYGKHSWFERAVWRLVPSRGGGSDQRRWLSREDFGPV